MTCEPRNPKTIGSRLARAGLWVLGGWKMNAPLPTEPQAVMLACPHTSNLDGLLLVLLTRSVGMPAKWMVKDTWTKPPIGWLSRRVGAVPVDRSKPNGMVGQMVERFESGDDFLLLIPPEGTRSLTDHWKSGFYRIATNAGVPVVPAYVDYNTRTGGFGSPIVLTGDIGDDMDKLREFYADGATMARKAEKFGPVRLADEPAGPERPED